MQILWYKRDLRVTDHAPLREALLKARDADPVLCLYVHEPSLIASEDCARQHTEFVRECLADLRSSLAAHGCELLELVGEAVDVFDRLRAAEPARITRILAHEEVTNLAGYARDRALKSWCREHGIEMVEHRQNAVWRGSVQPTSSWNDHLVAACQQPLINIDGLTSDPAIWAEHPVSGAAPEEIPMGAGADKVRRQRGGSTAARLVMAKFCEFNKLSAYPGAISSPNTAAEGCARISPYLSYGAVSDREVVRTINDLANLVDEKSDPFLADRVQKGVRFFAQRLYWRSGYLQLLETHSQLELGGEVDGPAELREQAFLEGGEAAQKRFEAWATGRTGVPMIDAGMRLLLATGWANFRLRGAVVSFALNELWLPWKMVGHHLARQFLDFEPAIHWCQIAIHAGLLKGSRPLIYSPIKQGRDHDAAGVFVRRWVPELSGIWGVGIHEPWLMPKRNREACGLDLGVSYPEPIVHLEVASFVAKRRVYALWEGKEDPGGLPFEASEADMVRKAGKVASCTAAGESVSAPVQDLFSMAVAIEPEPAPELTSVQPSVQNRACVQHPVQSLAQTVATPAPAALTPAALPSEKAAPAVAQLSLF